MPEMREMRALMAGFADAVARNEALVAEWSEREFTGSADKGGVVATVDPVGSLRRLDIGPLSKRRLDRASLAEAIVAAVHAAEAAAAAAKEEMLGNLSTGGRPGVGKLMSEARRDLTDRTGFPA
jgi:DNA-binding protein YbaB